MSWLRDLLRTGKSEADPKTNVGSTLGLSPKDEKTMTKIRSDRYTLDWWKCYLESCLRDRSDGCS